MAQHARLSASQTKEWGNCGGQLAMIYMLPDANKNDTNDAARLGTCAHLLLETCLGEGVDTEAYRGRIITIVAEGTDKEDTVLVPAKGKAPKDPTQFWAIVDDDMIEAVQEAVDHVRRRLMHHFGHQDTKAAVEQKQLFLERRLTILVHRDDSFGTSDITIDAWPEELESLDYKHGSRVPVEIVDHHGDPNKQLQSYALGTAELMGWDYATYRYTIIQPRAGHPDGRIRGHASTPEELQAFKEWLIKAADNVDRAFEILHDVASDTPDGSSIVELPDALLKAGLLVAGDQCTWCKAKYNPLYDIICPATVAAAQATAAMSFMDDPDEFVVEEKIPKVQEELARAYAWLPVLEAFIKGVKAASMSEVLKGERLPGFKLIRGKTSGRKLVAKRQATDTETGEPIFEEDGITPMLVPVTPEWLTQQLLEEYGMPEEKQKLIFDPPKMRSGPQLEKLIPAKLRKAFSDALMWKPPGPLKLVPAGAPGEEVTVDPGVDFEDDEVEMPEGEGETTDE